MPAYRSNKKRLQFFPCNAVVCFTGNTSFTLEAQDQIQNASFLLMCNNNNLQSAPGSLFYSDLSQWELNSSSGHQLCISEAHIVETWMKIMFKFSFIVMDMQKRNMARDASTLTTLEVNVGNMIESKIIIFFFLTFFTPIEAWL